MNPLYLLAILSICNPFIQIILPETEHKYETGIKLEDEKSFIANKIFIGTPIGIAVWRDRAVIQNCVFIGCDDEGIILLSDHNIVRNCFFFYCSDGIEMQWSCNNLIQSCYFFRNTHGIDAIQSDNNNNTLVNCVFYECSGTPIWYRQSNNNTEIDCTIIDRN